MVRRPMSLLIAIVAVLLGLSQPDARPALAQSPPDFTGFYSYDRSSGILLANGVEEFVPTSGVRMSIQFQLVERR